MSHVAALRHVKESSNYVEVGLSGEIWSASSRPYFLLSLTEVSHAVWHGAHLGTNLGVSESTNCLEGWSAIGGISASPTHRTRRTQYPPQPSHFPSRATWRPLLNNPTVLFCTILPTIQGVHTETKLSLIYNFTLKHIITKALPTSCTYWTSALLHTNRPCLLT
jgi:hypothetical protein